MSRSLGVAGDLGRLGQFRHRHRPSVGPWHRVPVGTERGQRAERLVDAADPGLAAAARLNRDGESAALRRVRSSAGIISPSAASVRRR